MSRMRSARAFGRMLSVMLVAAVACWAADGSTAAFEHSFRASKLQVQAALVKLQVSAGGRLPTVDGFVASQNDPLERFQRPHYSYSIQVATQPAGGSVLKVRARITAWYASPAPSQAGYRELASNGRLESDLFERLEDLLGPEENAGTPSSVGAPTTSASTRKVPEQPRMPALSSAESVFHAPRPGATVLPSRISADPSSSKTKDAVADVQGLKEQAVNLEEILRNQTHPTDLAAVRESRTPVYSRPSESAEVLFLAEAQDEFQVLNTNSDWVHVQISGLSRGWIRGPALELPTRSSPVRSAAATAPAATSAAAATEPPFRLAHQEVNTYPGDWAPLKGKLVRILSLQPIGAGGSTAVQKWETAVAMFHRAAARLAAQDGPSIEGVVLIFDSADGGMAAATRSVLQNWSDGRMSDEAFRAQCSFDPPEAFVAPSGQ